MKVFVSWSGDLSRAVATAIRELFPTVLQGLQVFMSKDDIESGMPWFEVIRQNLAESDVGIIVVTRQNQGQPWLLFEAGAIAAKTGKPHVIPLLIDLTNPDLAGPLAQYQAISLGREDIRSLLRLLNSLREEAQRLKEAPFDSTFEKWWTDLERGFSEAKERFGRAAGAPEPAQRPGHELITDVLTEVRKLSHQFDIQTSILTHIPNATAAVVQLAEAARFWLPTVTGTGPVGPTGIVNLGLL
jgi:hypothetical protein